MTSRKSEGRSRKSSGTVPTVEQAETYKLTISSTGSTDVSMTAEIYFASAALAIEWLRESVLDGPAASYIGGYHLQKS